MKNLKAIYIVSVVAMLIIFTGKMNAQELPTRDKIEDKYKWNLEDIYPSEDKWEADYKWVEGEISQVKKFKGKIGNSAENLLEVIKHEEDVEQKINRMAIYAFSYADLDLNNGHYQSMRDKLMKLVSEYSAASSFIQPEILEMDYATVKSYLAKKPALKPYEHMMERIFRMKEHSLPADQERILALMGPIEAVPSDAYTILNDAELPFPKIKDPDGNEVQLSHGRYRSGLFHENRDYRRDVYKGAYVPYDMLKGTFAALYKGRATTRITEAELRNYKSPIEAALYGNNIPVAVYDNLVESVNENLSTLHRWAEIKKKALGYDELHPYDTFVSLFPSVQKSYTYDEAVKIVVKALKPLGKEYNEALMKSINERWIDVFETKGKRSGAYSNSSGVGPHPFILLNWNNTLDDMFTLAHEIGHNMHSYFTEKYQPQQYANYSTFVAEVASITNEALLLDYLIENAESEEEKKALLEKFLVNAQQTFFRQTRFGEFEARVHRNMQEGKVYNADELTKLFGDLYKKYWGPAMVMDREEGLSWERIPHLFKYNFYVFQYSTSFAAAQALADKIKSEGQPAIDRYLTFLKSGNSDYPINVLKKAGVDMSTKQPIEQTITRINSYLDELERSMN